MSTIKWTKKKFDEVQRYTKEGLSKTEACLRAGMKLGGLAGAEIRLGKKIKKIKQKVKHKKPHYFVDLVQEAQPMPGSVIIIRCPVEHLQGVLSRLS